MTSVPRVSVFDHNDASTVKCEVQLPDVFSAPIRQDIVQFVHTNLCKNSRQARGVDPLAGMRHAAISWGPGRAVARIPRVTGSGSQRTGQAAFGNMTRKGRMFAPLKTWRRWHRKVNLKQRRFAVASALAASAVTPLVMARGHRVDNMPTLPLVLDDSFQDVEKTKGACAVLRRFGLWADVQRCIDSRTLRAGRGKARNRRHVMKVGPLVVVHDRNCKVALALRNVPGVDVAVAGSLDLRQLAPGAHLGRLCVWTQTAFESTRSYGSRSCLSNADVQRIINSNEVQSVLNDVKQVRCLHQKQKKNPLRNARAMMALNPHRPSAPQRRNKKPTRKMQRNSRLWMSRVQQKQVNQE